MQKLISNPYECGYCDIETNFRDDKCKHPKKKSKIICKGDKFPEDCPLENIQIKKYALTCWNVKTQKMEKFPPKNPKYVSEKEFIDDDWQEKAFDIDKNDFILE